MSRKTKSKIINGCEYSCTQMNAIDAFRAQSYLAKIILPIISDINIEQFNQENFINCIKKSLPDILEKINDEKFQNFFIKMCEEAFRDGERVNFNRCYTGNLNEAYLAFVFVLEVNFMDFLNGAAGMNLKELFTPDAPKKKSK